MGKKEEKRLCWNCDGYVSFDSERCPYCASELASPNNDQNIPEPPYAPPAEFSVTKEEWDNALVSEKNEPQKTTPPKKNELVALILLLPGVFLVLFALLLLFCSKNGSLTLEWKENFAFIYLMGAAPLIILGLRLFK